MGNRDNLDIMNQTLWPLLKLSGNSSDKGPPSLIYGQI